MHDMIRRQELAARLSLLAGTEFADKISPPADGARLVFVGIGTSYHAALAGENQARTYGGGRWPTLALPAFELADPSRALPPGDSAFFFSASGETALTLQAQERWKEAGRPSVLLSATANSPSSALTDSVVLTRQADEASWTHTVSYTAAVCASHALFGTWAGAPASELDIDVASAGVAAAVASESSVVTAAERLSGCDRILLLGSGAGEVAAREGALKVREAAGRFVTTAGIEEALHGILPSVNERTAVIAVVTTDYERQRARSVARAVAELGAPTWTIDLGAASGDDQGLALPAVPSGLVPAVGAIPLQLLAYWLAVGDGKNPDVMGLDDAQRLAARRTFGI